MLLIAPIIYAATLIVYVMKKSLYTLAGRCEFTMFLGIFILVAARIIHRFITRSFVVIYLYIAAIPVMFLWTLVLIFDIWSTLRWDFFISNIFVEFLLNKFSRNNRNTQNVTRRFVIYCCCVFVTSILLVYVLFSDFVGEDDPKYFLRAFLITVFLGDIILIMWTGCLIFKQSKVPQSTDHAWLEAEKER